jgi:hypothetical protein
MATRRSKALPESTQFSSDPATPKDPTNEDKNSQLATLLNGAWADLAIVRVERIEIGGRGWRVVFRE